MKWTDYDIYGEGIIMIGELLKSNTTLIKLNLKGEKKDKNIFRFMKPLNIDDNDEYRRW